MGMLDCDIYMWHGVAIKTYWGVLQWLCCIKAAHYTQSLYAVCVEFLLVLSSVQRGHIEYLLDTGVKRIC